MLWPRSDLPQQGEVEVTLLDVGQGLAAVVQTNQHVLVFDTGPKFSENFDTGAAVVIPFIRGKNISKLDMVIVSHKDNDHSGGLKSIQQKLEVGKLVTSYDEKDGEQCVAGQRWTWDGVLFEMLNPVDSKEYKKRNNASCVLKVSAGKDSLLFSADIEKMAEKQLVDTHYKQLKSTYLVSPHHGSKTSSSQRFLDAVDPEYILIPVGFRNRYRMPHSTVLRRYRNKNILVLQTYKAGAISVRFGQKSSSNIPQQFRKESRKYWHSYH